MKKIGLLVMSFGTAEKIADIEPYYTHIRGGNKPPQHLLNQLVNRFHAIGDSSPLLKITQAQAKALADELNQTATDTEFVLAVGYLHVAPFIEQAVEQLAAAGVDEAVSIVLAPQDSRISLQQYQARAQMEADNQNLLLTQIGAWFDEPLFIKTWADNLQQTLQVLPENETAVIFTAHSIPKSVVEQGDPYVAQIKETAKLIAKRIGLAQYFQTFQSAGRTPFPWIGPDVLDKTRELAQTGAFKEMVYVPISFVADYLEVLYDNDEECRQLCQELSLGYHRPAMPNTQPDFIKGLAHVIQKAL